LSESSGALWVSRCGSSSAGARTLRRGKVSATTAQPDNRARIIVRGGPSHAPLPHADRWEARRYTGDITLFCMHAACQLFNLSMNLDFLNLATIFYPMKCPIVRSAGTSHPINFVPRSTVDVFAGSHDFEQNFISRRFRRCFRYHRYIKLELRQTIHVSSSCRVRMHDANLNQPVAAEALRRNSL